MPKLPARPYVPGTAFTMWAAPTYPFPASSPVWYGHSLRQQIAPLTGVGEQFRFTFDQGAGLAHASFELQDSGYNTLYGPVEITFGGGNHGFFGGRSLGGSSIISDWITLPHFIDNTMKMIVIIDVSTSSDSALGAEVVGGSQSWGSQLAAASYNIAAPTTGIWTVSSNIFGLAKVEAR